jgi:glyoxylase-like metal-dependent hydrolase (beta-lactamase superfamily II)
MRYAIVPVTPFSQNCTVLWCEATREAAVVDPGGDLERVQAVLEKESLKLTHILVTHAHIDHVGGVADLSEQFSVPILGPEAADSFWIDALPEQSRMFGLPKVRSFAPTRWLHEGDQVRFGNVTLEVLHCPGHTPGHVVFYHRPNALLQVGDVLFQSSVGRSDLPGGDHETLIRSIREKLLPLGDKVAFISGHGPMSTLGDERRFNPYLNGHFG